MVQQIPFFISQTLSKLIDAIQTAGGTPIAVGGCVRDYLLGIPSKDIDIEVYGMDAEQLESALTKVGKVFVVGKSFGVLKAAIDETIFDVSLPRRESKTARGHRGFEVKTDPNLSFEEASARRDFTVNAMGYDVVQHRLLDPHGGQSDLDKRVLRHVSDAFDEDPLRVLRACQFAARFELSIAPETLQKCHNLRAELSSLPKERIYEEIRKLLLAKKPSIGMQALVDTQAISLFPELEILRGCPQDPQWHPEGDVWIHTCMVVDQARIICEEDKLSDDETILIMLGALCHDLGKPGTTQFEDGRVRSKGHEEAGTKPTQQLLASMGFPASVTEEVVPLVIDHLKPMQLYKSRDKVGDSAIRRLARRVNIERLCRVARADFLGRTTEDALQGTDPSADWLMEQAKRLAVEQNAPAPILIGRHLIGMGFAPGPSLGRALKQAYEAQLDGEFSDEAGGLSWAKSHLQNS